jgi:class 3 adenylate cyclase/predicted ATPase/energy-coupling factor transporter ATP-binding protein EcfA2
MTFEEILDQAIAMLQRRGRLTYGALKRQFQLDDAYLDDVKAELIEGQRVAVDEDGRVLVWTSGTAVSPTTTTQAPQPAPLGPPLVTADVQPAQGLPLPAVPQSANAERRQLTVMFCDLVDSTALSGQLDPEDLREVVRAYQHVCAEVITRFDGHIAQLLGDGLLVYFGYPHVHEDDTQRAVRTGLGMLAAMEELNSRLRRDKGIQLALRLGIHTGLVVVGAMGGPGRQDQLALGETPNIAARIQGLAAPNTLMISQATYRLIQGYFECQDVGAQTLRGVSEPVHVYRVLQESGARGRLDVAVTRGLTPLVGREQEVGLLVERWAQVKAGHGHVVLLTGDAGIGKSRLVQMLKEHVAHEPHRRWECRSSEYYQNTALFPLTDLFQRLLQFHAEDTPDEKLGKLEHALSQYSIPVDESVQLFAPLLSLALPEQHYPPPHLSPQRQRQKTLESLVAILLELAEQQPVLFILEDLHWSDPTTLEFLGLLVEQVPTTAIYTLLTCRPHFQPAWHHRSYITEMTLNHLAHTQVEQIVTGVTNGKALPQEVRAQIVEKTDGVPLFVEEMTKAILESGHLKAVDGHYELTGSFSTFAIPATLQDSLMARLDRLVTAKGIAQLAAIIGRQFPYDLLQAVSQLEEAMLQHELGRLMEAEIIYRRGVPPHATYIFKHALIQDAAYQSLLKSTRQQYHQRIAQVLEAQFLDTAEAEPELLAHHYTEAGLTEQAIGYWQRAGQRASDRSAHLEAISHYTTGIELLTTLPETPEHTRQALTLHIALGVALQMAKGLAAPEVEHAYTQAHTLCQQVGETPELAQVLFGLWRFYTVRPQWRTARELGETLLRLAQRAHDPALAVIAHYALGSMWLWVGALPAARQHLEEAIARYTPDQRRAPVFRMGQDPGVACRAYAAMTLWLLGYPDQALARLHDALALAHELSHPFSLAWARGWTSCVYQLRRDMPAVQAQAEATVALATEQGSAFRLAQGTSMRGWARAMQGQCEEGIAQIRQGITAWRASGAAFHIPYLYTLLAEVCDHLGHTADGLQALAEAHTLMEQQEERWCEAEVYRLRGVLLLRQTMPQPEEAEACFRQAIDIARRQEAKSLELRAVMSLSRLWQSQGKRAEAHELLAPVYGWFTEGFETADLQEAKALLDALV